jgi:PAS domain S-box-containing protein
MSHQVVAVPSEAKFLALLEAAPDPIVIIDANGKISLVNRRMEEVFGYHRETLLGQELEILIPARYQLRHLEHRQQYQRAPRTRPMGAGLALYARRQDGSEFPVEISLSPVQTDAGLVVISIIRDVTNRKQVEEQLQQAKEELEQAVAARTEELLATNAQLKEQIAERERAEEKIREQAALLDVTLDAIMVQDLTGRLIFWNKGAERLYGWTAAEVVGQEIDKLLFKILSVKALEARQQIITQGEWSGELVHVTKTGREITVESRCTLVYNAQGQPKYSLIVNSDITEKKRLAAQFLRAQRMESIGTLAGGIAHDLNNALTPVLMAAQLLEERLQGPDTLSLLNMIITGAIHCSDMVKQVLSFARGIEGERITLQIGSLIKEIVKILRQTLPKSIQIESLIPNNLWTVDGDATQLHQVLMNLCINARDAMPQGGQLTIKADNVHLDENFARMHFEAQLGDYVLISVNDAGVGIPPENLEKIFDPFFTTKEIGKGTGLGLSTAMAIVRSHNGFIDVYSEFGKGTSFKIYLPTNSQRQEAHSPSVSTPLPLGQGQRILVVEDEQPIREITCRTLESYGYYAISAADGIEALAIYVKHLDTIDVVLLDIMMPHLDGQTTIPVLQRLNSNVKIIATSGLTSNQALAESAGVKAFLPKPYTAEMLLTLLAQVINPDN